MSDKDQRKVPLLRFKGFTNDWEQRKLGDIANVYDGTHTTPDYQKNGIMFISVENIDTLTSKKFITKSDYLENYKHKPEYHDIFMTRIGSIGKTNILETHDPRAFYVSLALIKPKDIDPYYLKYWLSSNTTQKEIWRRTLQIAFPQKINKDEISKVQSSISKSKNEQYNIGQLLNKIDHLLLLQQRKLDRLLLLKKAYLTNLLPDKTQNPKVRFKEFNDKWKKLKLGNISSISAGGDVNKQKLLKKGRYPVIANALTNKGVIGYYESKYRIQAPAVTVTGRGDIGHAYARKTNFTPVVRLLSIKSKHNVDFLAEAINQKKVPFESTGVPQLTVPKLSNYKILFPSSITEENKIGNFIIKFDEIINLQNKKISSLEQVKNFLLQNMFI